MTLTPDDPILSLRAQLAREIVRALGGSFAQHFISARYDIPQPRMSELCRGKVERCSMEWLIRRIHRMGGTVSLTIVLGDPEQERGRREALERY
jgi:predicted XRE-type DNA-binding protein